MMRHCINPDLLTGVDSFGACSCGELRDFKAEMGKEGMKYPLATSILMQVTRYLCVGLLCCVNSVCAARPTETAVICALQNAKIQTISHIVCS